MDLENDRLVGQTLRLDGNEGHVLGPNLTLVDCSIEIACPASALTIAGLTMSGGQLNAKKKLSNFSFGRSSFDQVRFVGNYAGCDFGRLRPDELPTIKIDACDFSDAVLDECRITNADLSKCKFAGWPTVVVENPAANADAILSGGLPESWDGLLETLARSPEYYVAVIVNADISRKRHGGDETQIRDFFQTKDFIRRP